MSPELNQKARQIFEEALDLPPAKRVRFLDFACADSAELRREAARLLDVHEKQAAPASGLNQPAPPVRQINRYLIKSELGRGAMGAVYEAEDSVIGRTVALKVLHTQALTDETEVKSLEDRLFREASSAGRLAHPGIVTVFDVGKEGEVAFIAMERVEGPTLQQLMRKGKIDRVRTLEILWQAAAALDYAHAAGIIHRDIKPANIMLHKGTQAKIADFGIAKVNAMSQLTVAGTILGTPSYMSPEQIQNFDLTGRSDQFSLAVVAYEMLTGARPFERDTVAALLLSVVNGQRPAASAADPTLPPLVDEVFRMALNKSPDERFATCSAFVNALCTAAGIELVAPAGSGTGIQTRTQPPAPVAPLPPPPPAYTAPPPPPPISPQPAKGAPFALYIGVGLLVLVLAAAWPVYRYVYPKPVTEPARRVDSRPPDSPALVITAPPAASGAPVVSLFTAEPERVQPGSAATLRWWVTGAAEVVLNHDIGKVAGKGSIEVKPLKETEYILTATGPGGDVTAKVTVGFGAGTTKPTPVAGGISGVAVAPNHKETPPEGPKVDSARAQQLYDEGVAKHRGQSGAEAATLFEQAAGMGEPRAMLELGKMHAAGDGVAKDLPAAAAWYRKSAELGNASAMVFLGALYVQGSGVAKDAAEAAKWIRKAADAGNPVGMDGLGQMYLSGQGVPVDAAEAVTWFRKGVNAGNAPAMYHLGLVLENGSGPVAKNPAEAAQLYQRAAAAGYAPAKAKLTGGSLTLTGIDPAAISENKSQIYRLSGSGFTVNTTVRTDLESSIGSKDGEKSNFHPVAVAPNGTWLAIYISLPAPQGRNTVKVLVRNPGSAEVALDVPIQR